MNNTTRLHNIHTVMHYDGETILGGTDEMGNDNSQVVIPTLELLEWLDRKEMVKSEVKRIKKLAI